MSTLTKEQEQYIEQEVKIRLHDEKFQLIERDFDEIKTSIHYLNNKLDASIERLDNKLDISIKHLDSKLDASVKYLDGKFDNQFKWIIGLFVSSIAIPVILHFFNVV